MLWIFWFQTFIIFIFEYAYINQAQNISTDGLKINGLPVQATQETKTIVLRKMTGVILGFQCILGIFLLAASYMYKQWPSNYLSMFLNILMFTVSIYFHYRNSTKSYSHQPLNLGLAFSMVGLRIVPLIILVMTCWVVAKSTYANNNNFQLVFTFIIIKALIDLVLQTTCRQNK